MTLLQPRTQEAPRASPSAGWVGRRDRAVLVLSKMAGMSDEDIAGLTAGDVVIADAAATITAATGTITLPASDDSMICGPCALARWLHLLDMTVIYPDRYVIDAVIARAAPLSADSPHLCRGTHAVTDATRHLLLLPPIDRWGPISAIRAQRGPRDRRQPYAPGHGARPAATDHQAAETCWATERYATGNPGLRNNGTAISGESDLARLSGLLGGPHPVYGRDSCLWSSCPMSRLPRTAGSPESCRRARSSASSTSMTPIET